MEIELASEMYQLQGTIIDMQVGLRAIDHYKMCWIHSSRKVDYNKLQYVFK